MKFLRDLLFTQYYELRKKDRPVQSAKGTGLILASVFIVLALVALVMILMYAGVFRGVHSPISGKNLGKIGALILFAISYAIMYFMYGNKQKYENLIATYESLPPEDQEHLYKKTMRIMLLIFVVLMAVIIGLATIM